MLAPLFVGNLPPRHHHASTAHPTNTTRNTQHNAHTHTTLQELRFLAGVVSAPARPFAAIVGGSKVSSKIGVLQALLPAVDTLIIGCVCA